MKRFFYLDTFSYSCIYCHPPPNQLAGIYLKEQAEYIQIQIDKIRDSVEDRQSRIAWQTNEVSRRKSTAKAKLKAASQQERVKLWEQHFKNLLGNPPKITDEPITRIISKQLDIKLGPFTKEELDSVLRRIKNRKAAGLDEIPPEVWKTRQFDDILLRQCNAVYSQNRIERWMKGCILPFPKKGDLGLAKNYRGITSIAVKIYNALLWNRIEPKRDNILRKNQNGFWRNRSTTSQILTICRILEGVRAKNLQATLLFVDFTKAFDSIHRGKMEQILLAYGLPKETVAAIMILYRNTEVKVRSPDGDTEYFDIVAGVLQGDTLAPYLFIIWEEAKDTPQKQSRTPTTLMTWRYWRIRLIKQRHYCIVWNEPQLALASISMHTKLNLCVTTKRATLPH